LAACSFASSKKLDVTNLEIQVAGGGRIVSGTVAYAVGCGRAVVSTPSVYAREVLADGRGLLAEARNPRSLATGSGALLRHPDYKFSLQARAYAYGHEMIWR